LQCGPSERKYQIKQRIKSWKISGDSDIENEIQLFKGIGPTVCLLKVRVKKNILHPSSISQISNHISNKKIKNLL
jgi:hypothetical protein